ncbi:hypothetical protein [Candidatus Ichthyocystis hellenicum]|uniref:hypothetical protein n=1 Tax=Candidatus Ichthyocystis hellenicum TaxID=1561003 RepID=UPI000B883CFB|nr:hypothetical protein [Candidatus Ichthyocystis hellenicum]
MIMQRDGMNKLATKLESSYCSTIGRRLCKQPLCLQLRKHSLEISPPKEHCREKSALMDFHVRFSRILLEIVQTTLRIQNNRQSSIVDCALIKETLVNLENCCTATFSKPILSETECSFEILFCLSNNMLSRLQEHIFKLSTKERSIRILSEYRHLFSSSSQQKWIDTLISTFHKMEVESLLEDSEEKRNKQNQKYISRCCQTFLNWFIKKIGNYSGRPMKINEIHNEYSALGNTILSEVLCDNLNYNEIMEEFKAMLYNLHDVGTSSIVKDFQSTSFSKGRILLIQIITNIDTLPSEKKNVASVCQKMSLALYECLDKYGYSIIS